MTDQTNTNPATESAAPVAAPALPAAYPSAGPVGAAIRATLGGFRAHDVASVPALAARLLAEAPESARSAIASLPVFVAGQGAFTVAELADPETAPALGFDGPATVSILGVRGRTFNTAGEPDPNGKAANADIGLTVIPDYSLEAIMAHPKHHDFLMKIIRKELSHTAANAMGAKDAPLAELAESAKTAMPVSVTDYLDRAAAAGTGGLYSVFMDNWSGYRAALAQNPANAAMLKLLPRKDDMLKAIRSTAYAQANFPGIESKGWFKAIGLRMAEVIAAAQAAAAESGEECQITGNPDHLRQWVAERDSVVIDAPSRAVDLDSINPIF